MRADGTIVPRYALAGRHESGPGDSSGPAGEETGSSSWRLFSRLTPPARFDRAPGTRCCLFPRGIDRLPAHRTVADITALFGPSHCGGWGGIAAGGSRSRPSTWRSSRPSAHHAVFHKRVCDELRQLLRAVDREVDIVQVDAPILRQRMGGIDAVDVALLT